MATRTLSRQSFVLQPDPAPTYTPVLIDARVPIITLVRALAGLGLRLTYDGTQGALAIQVLQ